MIAPSRHSRARRVGVTLVELLIVILIMLMITAVTVPAISPALEGRKIREGARMVEVYLNSARNRAIADNKIVGVRLEVDEDQPWLCDAVSLVEQPDPWAGDYQSSNVFILGNGGFGQWTTYPPYATPNLGVVALGSPFTGGDIGWVGNLAPGDTFYLGANDMVLYRLYAGEPFIDVNGNGIWDQPDGSPGVPNTNPSAFNNEPFNDVDGNGTYTPPNPATIDTDSGMFIGQPLGTWPQITWGVESAYITYTFADPIAAANAMHPLGCQINSSGGGPQYTPITLSSGGSTFLAVNAVTYDDSAPAQSIVPALLTTAENQYAFSFNRRPLPLSTPEVALPSGVVIDMGVNFLPTGSTNIVAAPGSGLDMVVAATPGQGYLGNFATFRAHPICDPRINSTPSTSAVARFNRSVIITFDPSGVVDRIYSWDERQFTTNTTGIASAIPNYSEYRGRLATSPIYFLIGSQELAGGDPEAMGLLQNGSAPINPAFNMQDPTSLWIAIQPRTGMITTTENVAPDLTIAPAGGSAAQLRAYLNAQVYEARKLAREGSDMGGM